MFYCDKQRKSGGACTDGICTDSLTCICLSARGYQEHFLLAGASSVRSAIKGGQATHFLAARRLGPSMAQLGLLRAWRREGTPLVPGGQTTPCCCPAGHKMSGKAGAQMEERACVRPSVRLPRVFVCQHFNRHVKCELLGCFSERQGVVCNCRTQKHAPRADWPLQVTSGKRTIN